MQSRKQAVGVGRDELLAQVQGHRLAEIRQNRGLTQQQVAERMVDDPHTGDLTERFPT